jgi:hypothetical protein
VTEPKPNALPEATARKSAWDEFFAPMIDEMRSTYAERIVELANLELSRDKRADKITALSNAIKILDQLEGGMLAAIRDGEMAQQEKLKAEKIEQMTSAATPAAGHRALLITIRAGPTRHPIDRDTRRSAFERQ